MGWFNSVARALLTLSCVLEQGAFTAKAIDLDPTNRDQVKAVSKKVAAQLVSQYIRDPTAASTPANVLSGDPGTLPYGTKDKYYWWLAGGMFGTLIDYWYYTGDTSYNQIVIDGIQAQIGAKNFLPTKWDFDIGNDDQLFWAFAVMSAAELGFPDPPDDKPGWLELAQSVMNQMITHLDKDPQACGGGIRWQNKPVKTGWDYKNTAANGGTVQLGFRLAKYTGNKTYADYANKIYNWLEKSPIIDHDYTVNDGTDVKKNCIDADTNQWTYNYGLLVSASAYAYAYTNDTIWKTRLHGFLNRTDRWFPDDTGGIMYERCERTEKGSTMCNGDQFSFKAYFTRWLTVAIQLVPDPDIMNLVVPRLQKSAKAAARTCNEANACGSRWYVDKFDDRNNVGSQMSALAIITSNLYKEAPKQVTASDGGTSKGNAATGTDPPPAEVVFRPLGTGDRAGAVIVTIMVSALLFGGAYWLITGE